jgi:hypothetical protein
LGLAWSLEAGSMIRDLTHKERRYFYDATQPGPLCPNPFKLTYPTVEAARAVADAQSPEDPTLDAYRCRCGAIHLGHSTANHRPPAPGHG